MAGEEASIVVSRLKGAVTVDEIDSYLKGLAEQASQHGRRFAALTDIRLAERVDAISRAKFAKRFEHYRWIFEGLLAGQAFVVSSVLQRGIVTAIQWSLSGPSYCECFDSELEARGWLTKQLTKNDVAVPSL